jgi:hypothetical protein
VNYSQSSPWDDSHYEYELLKLRAYPPLGSSSKRELAHPKSSDQNRTRANENANKGRRKEDEGKRNFHFPTVAYRTFL